MGLEKDIGIMKSKKERRPAIKLRQPYEISIIEILTLRCIGLFSVGI